MIPVGKNEKYYYIDLVEIDKFVRLDKSEEESILVSSDDDGSTKDKMYSIIKYDIIRELIAGVLNEYPSGDSDYAVMKAHTKEASIPYAISFNTLLFYKLIKEI